MPRDRIKENGMHVARACLSGGRVGGRVPPDKQARATGIPFSLDRIVVFKHK